MADAKQQEDAEGPALTESTDRKAVLSTPEDTIHDLLKTSKRDDSVPIRRAFVQHGLGKDSTPGPLAEFVRSADESGLDLLLLAKAVAASGECDVARPSQVWLRALAYCGKEIGPSALSRAWRRLGERKLVHRQKKDRLAQVIMLDESGNGEPYVRPGSPGTEAKTPYFKFPYAYWWDGWCHKLSLPAKAMLLVALTQDKRASFSLPLNHMQAWYGFSTDTAQRGFEELKDKGLLEMTKLYKKAPLTPAGVTEDRKYKLLEPFASRRGRDEVFMTKITLDLSADTDFTKKDGAD